jgi:RNA polymerase subunit RPABC4/transcription elongation factor Spt4
MLIFIVLSLLMAFAALLAVAHPILARTPGSEPAATSAEETIDELVAQRDAVFQALRELRFDHAVGKITDEDYVAFEGSLKQTAADSLRALDEWEARADMEVEPDIERIVAARAALVASGGIACPNCGRPAGPEDKFCGSCGAPLPEVPVPAEVAQACPNCGRLFEPGDRFCAECGQELPAPANARR